MDQAIVRDPVLRRFRAALEEAYGPKLDRAVLFGSRARGDAHPDSDYDVAVFLHDPASTWDELGRLSSITTGILLDTDAYISAKPFEARAYGDPSPFMQNVRRDGLEL